MTTLQKSMREKGKKTGKVGVNLKIGDVKVRTNTYLYS